MRHKRLALALVTATLAFAQRCGDSNTLAGPQPTASPVPAATPTPVMATTVIVNVRAWDFSPGGPISPPLVLEVGVTYTLIFHNVDAQGTTNARHGFSGVSELGLPSTDDISAGHDFVIPSFTPQAYQRGAHPFVCTQSNCGGDPEQHAGMVGSLIVQ